MVDFVEKLKNAFVESHPVDGHSLDGVEGARAEAIRDYVASAVVPGGPHHASHEDGGVDKVNVDGLTGVLADNQHLIFFRMSSHPKREKQPAVVMPLTSFSTWEPGFLQVFGLRVQPGQ